MTTNTTILSTVMPTTMADPTLIQMFGDNGIHSLLLIGVSIRWFSSIFGQLSNGALLYVTVRNR
jgi:hypothetical protein